MLSLKAKLVSIYLFQFIYEQKKKKQKNFIRKDAGVVTCQGKFELFVFLSRTWSWRAFKTMIPLLNDQFFLLDWDKIIGLKYSRTYLCGHIFVSTSCQKPLSKSPGVCCCPVDTNKPRSRRFLYWNPIL